MDDGLDYERLVLAGEKGKEEGEEVEDISKL